MEIANQEFQGILNDLRKLIQQQQIKRKQATKLIKTNPTYSKIAKILMTGLNTTETALLDWLYSNKSKWEQVNSNFSTVFRKKQTSSRKINKIKKTRKITK